MSTTFLRADYRIPRDGFCISGDRQIFSCGISGPEGKKQSERFIFLLFRFLRYLSLSLTLVLCKTRRARMTQQEKSLKLTQARKQVGSFVYDGEGPYNTHRKGDVRAGARIYRTVVMVLALPCLLASSYRHPSRLTSKCVALICA